MVNKVTLTAFVLVIVAMLFAFSWYVFAGEFYFQKSTQLAISDFEQRYPGVPYRLPGIFNSYTRDKTAARELAVQLKERDSRDMTTVDTGEVILKYEDITKIEEKWSLILTTDCKNSSHLTPGVHYIIVRFYDGSYRLLVQEDAIASSIKKGYCNL